MVDRFPVGFLPQHVVPAWDLQTLWVANNGRRRADGSLTPIDPKSGKPGPRVLVADPYNMYFTPDGKSAIVVAERLKRLDFRDPHTMALQQSLPTPACSGINHADFSIDGRYAIFTCEFRGGGLVKIDIVNHQVVGYLRLDDRADAAGHSRLARRHVFFMSRTCLPMVCFWSMATASSKSASSRPGSAPTVFIQAATGQSSTSPTAARTGSTGRRMARGASASSISRPATVEKTWPIPGGGSPDMGNVSIDGKDLWLSGRYDNVVYDIDTKTGAVRQISVGKEPHGLTVWPQPGRYSLGHTGNMR